MAAPQPTAVISIACQLCEDPACVAACPRDALSVREDGTICPGQGAVHRLRLVHRGVRLRRHRPGPTHQVRGHLRPVPGSGRASLRGGLPQEGAVPLPPVGHGRPRAQAGSGGVDQGVAPHLHQGPGDVAVVQLGKLPHPQQPLHPAEDRRYFVPIQMGLQQPCQLVPPRRFVSQSLQVSQ